MHQSMMKVCFQGYAVFWGGDPCKNVDCDTVTVKDVFLLLNLIPVCHHHVYAYSTTIGKNIYIYTPAQISVDLIELAKEKKG